MHSARYLGIAVLVATLAACQAPAPRGVAPPARGQPEIGVGYVVTVYCAEPIQLGSTWWTFQETTPWPPPMPDGTPDWWPFKTVSSPYAVPATVTLTSKRDAVFRAASDGSELRLSRRSNRPASSGGCL
jgi:hypothetical protein